MQPNTYSPLYTNEVSSESLRDLDQPCHTPATAGTQTHEGGEDFLTVMEG